MKREIKFRGICIKTGEWKYGYYVERTEPHDASHKIYDPIDGTWHAVRPETVGQYTEQKDDTKWKELTENERSKWVQINGNFPSEWKGKEIYEGGILSYLDDSNTAQIGIVEYGNISASYAIEAIGGDEEGNQDIELHADYDKWIIGSIHTNPELLK